MGTGGDSSGREEAGVLDPAALDMQEDIFGIREELTRPF